MLCIAMLCYAMLCYAMLCYAMLCYAMLYYTRLLSLFVSIGSCCWPFPSIFLPPVPFSDLSSHTSPIFAVVFPVFWNLLASLSRLFSVVYHLSFGPCVHSISPGHFANYTSYTSNFFLQVFHSPYVIYHLYYIYCIYRWAHLLFASRQFLALNVQTKQGGNEDVCAANRYLDLLLFV